MSPQDLMLNHMYALFYDGLERRDPEGVEARIDDLGRMIPRMPGVLDDPVAGTAAVQDMQQVLTRRAEQLRRKA